MHSLVLWVDVGECVWVLSSCQYTWPANAQLTVSNAQEVKENWVIVKFKRHNQFMT